MYKKQQSGGRPFHSRHDSGKKFGNRPVGKKTFAKQGQFSDISKFVKKADTVSEVKPYVAVNKFTDFLIDQNLKNNILTVGYTQPTAIQDQAIPYILDGKDLVGIANTGTGKTATFIIPFLNRVIKDRKQKVLIMAPTRELAIQINHAFMKLANGLSIYSVCLVGGMPINRQIGDLHRNYNFIIGTPGRIKDLANRNCVKLNEFSGVVLDEADRMLDMGFIHDMRFIISALPKTRQTLLFSATLSNDIKKIVNDFVSNPVNISVKTGDTACGVDQDVVYVKSGSKIDILHNLLKNPEFDKVLIFGRTKHGVQRLSKILAERGFRAESIHGNKNHSQRQRALIQFKENKSKILVATDVAARGLDIPNVSHVINYELPATYEDYIHRIGRTGRAGKTGKALTFVG
jgi:superfamily II DNA/RNA helicase